MRVAYLVTSYRNPEQVLRLASALGEGPGSEVVISHNQREEPLAPRAVEARGAHLLPHQQGVRWGSWEYLQALLRGFAWITERFDPDWVLVLSGQDYPLRPLGEIEAFLGETGHDAFLGDVQQLDMDHRPEPPEDEFFLRYAYRHFELPESLPAGLRRRLSPRSLRSLFYLREPPEGLLAPRLGIRRLRTPYRDGFRCFVSSDWVTLSRRALEALERAGADRRLTRYYRRVYIPTESFIATALFNDPALDVAGENRRFVAFDEEGTHARVLTSADLDRLEASGADFARKFDPAVDGDVLDALDERRGRDFRRTSR